MATRTEHALTDWHHEVWGADCTEMRGTIYRKLCEEVGELGQALIEHDCPDYRIHVLEEAGDVAVALLNLLRVATGQHGLGVVMATVHDKLLERQRLNPLGYCMTCEAGGLVLVEWDLCERCHEEAPKAGGR